MTIGDDGWLTSTAPRGPPPATPLGFAWGPRVPVDSALDLSSWQYWDGSTWQSDPGDPT